MNKMSTSETTQTRFGTVKWKISLAFIFVITLYVISLMVTWFSDSRIQNVTAQTEQSTISHTELGGMVEMGVRELMYFGFQLITAKSLDELNVIKENISVQHQKLEQIIDKLKNIDNKSEFFNVIKLINKARNNIDQIVILVQNRLKLSEEKTKALTSLTSDQKVFSETGKQLMSDISTASTIRIQKAFDDTAKKLFEFSKQHFNTPNEVALAINKIISDTSDVNSFIIDSLTGGLQPLGIAMSLGNDGFGILKAAADASNLENLEKDKTIFFNTLDDAQKQVAEITAFSSRDKMQQTIDIISKAGEQDNSLFQLREQELNLLSTANELFQETNNIFSQISVELHKFSNSLIEIIHHDIAQIISEIKYAKILSVISLCSIALSTYLILHFYVQRRVIDRLQQIIHALKLCTTGNLSLRVVKDKSNDEISEMGSSYNQMVESLVYTMGQLGQSRDQLQQYATKLEKTVNERTQDIRNKNVKLTETVKELEIAKANLEVAKNEATEATVAKSQFLANMSHELRTPLNAIIGYSEMLGEELVERGLTDFNADLSKINASGKHLLSLINDVLDLSKIEAGKMTIFLEDASLKSIIHDISAIAQPLVEKRHNQFKMVLPPDFETLTMHTDVIKVRQCLLNLISNAAKFTENGTISLEIDCFEKGDVPWIQFAVNDTGIGISPEQLDRVFKSFTQAESSTTRKYGGTGLGLFLTERFCNFLGGKVTVTSKVNVGSTFTMLLPLITTTTTTIIPQVEQGKKVPTTPSKTTVEIAEAAAPSASLPTVLVIDDSLAVHDFVDQNFRKVFHFLHAYTAQDGLRQARKYQPDAITLDMVMTGFDGWELLNELKSDESLRNIPIVMFTMSSDKEVGCPLGVADCLIKPINPKLLLETLAKHLLGKPAYVLVVDDDQGTREYLHRILTKAGWQVSLASNGYEAVEILQNSMPSVMLLDLIMPEMNGFQVIEFLRSDKRWAQLHVIVITSKDLTEEDRVFLKGNVQFILQKRNYLKKELLDIVQKEIQESIKQRKEYLQSLTS